MGRRRRGMVRAAAGAVRAAAAAAAGAVRCGQQQQGWRGAGVGSRSGATWHTFEIFKLFYLCRCLCVFRMP
jgi:hypothetical protein